MDGSPKVWTLFAMVMVFCASSACATRWKEGSANRPKDVDGSAIPASVAYAGLDVRPAVAFAGPKESDRRTKLLRFPDIHGELIVFTYAGDLWLVGASGGTASRLTAHAGLELFPKFSPDGRTIAFTGQYGGDEQVYIVSTGGGEPRQLTFYPARGPLPARWGYDNQVYGWSPDGSKVLFRTMRDGFSPSQSRLYLVPAAGGLPEPLPPPQAGGADLHSSGKRLVYSPRSRDFRTWKRYEGGWAQDLYLFDLDGKTATRITDHPRADRDPMWLGDRVYFGSDRDGTHNIYRYDPASGETAQVTRYDSWDVRWPSSDGANQIVFELDGELHVLAADSGQTRRIDVYVPDDGARTAVERVDARKYVESFHLGPTGRRALLVARGDVFSVPVEHGLVRNLTHSSRAHEREADFSADGKRIAFVSDLTGEEQIWIAEHDGSRPPRALTADHRARLYHPVWAPHGKRIAYSDHAGKLYVVTVPGGRVTEIADDPNGPIRRDYSWSPDGEYLAFSKGDPGAYSSIYLWQARTGRVERVTGASFHEHTPAWHPGGKHLYFLSDREFHPQLDFRDFNFVANRATGIYALALAKDSPNPFPPRDDEAGGRPEPDEKKKTGGKHGEGSGSPPKPVPVRVHFEGLGDRITRVPVDPDNYVGLVAAEGHLLYSRLAATYLGRDPEFAPMLMAFSIEKRKAEPIVKEVGAWSVSRDGKKVLVYAAKEETYSVHDVESAIASAGSPKPPGDEVKKLDLGGLVVDRVAAEEWTVVFHEVWRRFRDHFYVDGMHGYDWKMLADKYLPLLAHVGHRSDLNYIIGEMVAELNVSHAYVTGGDQGLPQRPNMALLGARFELDRGAGRYRIAEIFRGQNAEPLYRSPLTEVGVDVAAGDYIVSINGRRLGAAQNPYELLQLPVDKPVELVVSADAAGRKIRRVLVSPIKTEENLLYLRWTQANRDRVAAATGGRVGYLHLPDMGADGLREFLKWYYGQVRRDGLIVDVRGNGGGFVSQLILERLRRKLLGTDFGRNAEVTYTYPSVVFHGHMAVLINETSGSDGDIFPWMFRQAGLGPLIGKRTWGGVVGITDHGPLIDGGEVYAPEFGTASATGEWIIEGRGVEPDIEVDNDPIAVIAGKDPQLERGIAEVMQRIKSTPMRLPDRPESPVKTAGTPFDRSGGEGSADQKKIVRRKPAAAVQAP